MTQLGTSSDTATATAAATAAASDELLLPRLVASALLPALARLLPHTCDALSAASNALLRNDYAAELLLFDLPTAAAAQLAAAAVRALDAACDSLAVPVLLGVGDGSGAIDASSAGSGAWVDVAAASPRSPAGGASSLASAPSPQALLFALAALRLLHSVVQWREVVADAELQRLALQRVVVDGLGALLDYCEAPALPPHARVALHLPGTAAAPVAAQLVPAAAAPLACQHFGGTLLASVISLVPPAWLAAEPAGEAARRIRAWTRTALAAAAVPAGGSGGSWLSVLRSAASAWRA